MFNHIEEEALRIKINPKERFNDIINVNEELSCDLPTSVTNLFLENSSFIAEADRKGEHESGIIWIIQENVSINDMRYSEGDIQLISCMIAACQTNYRNFGELYLDKMVGIKIRGDRVSFYSLEMKEEYLNQLAKGVPKMEIEVNKYPPKLGLKLSSPQGRREIINNLWIMKNYALTLNKYDNIQV